MTDLSQQNPDYTTLQDIQARRNLLLAEIRKDGDRMSALKKELFGKGVTSRGSKRMSMSGMINTGAGIFDGLLLVWKLYRKFKK